jgi:hypothetical protein
MKINFTSWAVANNFGSFIEINKDLLQYPQLLAPILQHELSHSDKSWSFHDFKVDFFESTSIKRLELLKFMLKRPRTWIQLLPFYWTPSKGFIVDINKTIIYSILLSIFVIDFIAIRQIFLKGGF